MDASSVLAVGGIVLSLTFAFTNGYNDAGADVATMVASGAASVKGALLTASLANFIGAMVGGSAVVLTVQGILTADLAGSLGLGMFCAVLAAIAWNAISWYYGIPSSSTHALIGGLVGVGVALQGMAGVNWGTEELLAGQLVGVVKVIAFLLVSVLVGFGGSFLLMKLARIALRRAKVGLNAHLRRLQWLTTGFQTLAHGANDAQKQMALIALALMTFGNAPATVPLWARVACATAIGLGSLGGGYRIMRTVGRRIFKLRPVHALVVQANTSLTVALSTAVGAPVSSTQVVTAGVMGVGSAENRKLVHWQIGKDLIASWFLTIPATAGIAAVAVVALRAIMGG
ncbi:MAG TPA: inorganic phosphate transporter [Methanomassiliicoccales archaeon]|nr:inorganic phosphate transporter [Methanomassiliicoccales archaeon]HQM66196.1 inorganic phosphate transporter [Methanomassiliicoccales archaeon]